MPNSAPRHHLYQPQAGRTAPPLAQMGFCRFPVHEATLDRCPQLDPARQPFPELVLRSAERDFAC